MIGFAVLVFFVGGLVIGAGFRARGHEHEPRAVKLLEAPKSEPMTFATAATYGQATFRGVCLGCGAPWPCINVRGGLACGGRTWSGG